MAPARSSRTAWRPWGSQSAGAQAPGRQGGAVRRRGRAGSTGGCGRVSGFASRWNCTSAGVAVATWRTAAVLPPTARSDRPAPGTSPCAAARARVSQAPEALRCVPAVLPADAKRPRLRPPPGGCQAAQRTRAALREGRRPYTLACVPPQLQTLC